MRRNANNTGTRADKFFEVFGIARNNVVALINTGQRFFDETYTSRHIFCRTVAVMFNLTPFRILTVNDRLHPYGDRRHRHLNKIPGVIDRLGQRRRQHDQFTLIVRRLGSIRFMAVAIYMAVAVCILLTNTTHSYPPSNIES